MQTAAKGRPTGQGYPQHFALFHQGFDGWELCCVCCRTWCGHNARLRGRGPTT